MLIYMLFGFKCLITNPFHAVACFSPNTDFAGPATCGNMAKCLRMPNPDFRTLPTDRNRVCCRECRALY